MPVQCRRSAGVRMNNKVLVFIVVLLAVASFLAGAFFTKVQYLEKGRLQTAQVTPAPQAAAQPSPTVLGVEQVAKLTEGGHAKGQATAKVVMVEFSDFQCPYCGRYATETFPQIDKDYIKTGKVRYIFYHYPLTFHQYAQKAAEAAECAGEQGKFWEMHDKLFKTQDKLTVADLKQDATTLGLNAANFNTCLDSGKYEDQVQADFTLGQNVGVQGTPAFFVNGKPISGAQPIENFKQVIEEELKK